MIRFAVKLMAAFFWTMTAYAQSPLQVDDYLLDQSQYVGKMVTLVGSAMCLSVQMCILSKDGEINASIYFDPSALPRAQRKALLGCNIYANKCIVALTGQGGDSSITDEFKAVSMEPQ